MCRWWRWRWRRTWILSRRCEGEMRLAASRHAHTDASPTLTLSACPLSRLQHQGGGGVGKKNRLPWRGPGWIGCMYLDLQLKCRHGARSGPSRRRLPRVANRRCVSNARVPLCILPASLPSSCSGRTSHPSGPSGGGRRIIPLFCSRLVNKPPPCPASRARTRSGSGTLRGHHHHTVCTTRVLKGLPKQPGVGQAQSLGLAESSLLFRAGWYTRQKKKPFVGGCGPAVSSLRADLSRGGGTILSCSVVWACRTEGSHNARGDWFVGANRPTIQSQWVVCR